MIVRWAAVAAVAGLIGGCAAGQEAAVGDLAAERASIRWTSGPLADVDPVRRVSVTQQEIEEYAGAVAGNGGPRGEAILIAVRKGGGEVALNPPYRLRTVDGTLTEWRYTEGNVEKLGDWSQIRFKTSALVYQRFRHAGTGRTCVGFHADWDKWTDDPNRRPLRIFFGYVCHARDDTMTATEARRIVRGITVRGGRETPAIAPPTITVDMGLPKELGTDAFPYTIARRFSPRDGGDDEED